MTQPAADDLAQALDDPPYGSELTIVAILLTIFVPFISLVVALVMRAQELRPKRRQFLKNWAIAAAAWLCTGWLVAVIAFSAISSGASGCKGGSTRWSRRAMRAATACTGWRLISA